MLWCNAISCVEVCSGKSNNIFLTASPSHFHLFICSISCNSLLYDLFRSAWWGLHETNIEIKTCNGNDMSSPKLLKKSDVHRIFISTCEVKHEPKQHTRWMKDIVRCHMEMLTNIHLVAIQHFKNKCYYLAIQSGS